MEKFYQFSTKRGKNYSVGVLVDEYLSGKVIYAPESLIAELETSGFNRTSKELCCLIYNIIRRKCAQNKNKPFPVYSKSLEFGTSSATTNVAKKWLKDNGYIHYVKSYSNSESRKSSIKYWAIPAENEELLILNMLSQKNGTGYTQQNDRLCIYTRKMLDNLHFDIEEIKIKLNQEINHLSKIGKEQIINYHASRLLDIIQKSGLIRRGKNANRLYSPFVTLKKCYRGLFSFDGERMVNIDMSSAHPTLLGNLSEDQKLIEDCIKDEFYGKMPSFSRKGRDYAKTEYYKLAFGPPRKNFPATVFFQEEYPKAYKFMLDHKPNKFHQKFSHLMQNKESFLWIDCIYGEIAERNISALSIHDSIFCKQTDKQEIISIIDNVMKEHNIKYKLHTE